MIGERRVSDADAGSEDFLSVGLLWNTVDTGLKFVPASSPLGVNWFTLCSRFFSSFGSEFHS